MAWTFYAVELRPYRKDQASECQQRLVLGNSVPGEGAYIVRPWRGELDIPSLPKVVWRRTLRKGEAGTGGF